MRERCPNATLCADPFHVVSWVNAAIDAIRRRLWNEARRAGDAQAKWIKGTRYVLLKGRENLTDNQKQTLADLETFNQPLYRAYLLKEELRAVFQAETPDQAKTRLAKWLADAAGSDIQEMQKVARTVKKHRAQIEASLDLGQTNAKAEAANTKIRLIVRRAFGFHSAQAVISLAMLTLGGLCPPIMFA